MSLFSRLLPAAALLFTFFAFSAFSAGSVSSHHHPANPQPAEQPLWQSEGVVKKVTDRQITLSHHAINALNWPPMTMAFDRPAQDAAQVQVGDKVAFTFSQRESGYQLVDITPAQ